MGRGVGVFFLETRIIEMAGLYSHVLVSGQVFQEPTSRSRDAQVPWKKCRVGIYLCISSHSLSVISGLLRIPNKGFGAVTMQGYFGKFMESAVVILN